MLLVATTSFFIHKIELWGPYSPIHLLSIWTIFCRAGCYYVRIGNIKRQAGDAGIY